MVAFRAGLAERYPFLKPCPWQATTLMECSMMREREVAGTDQSIPWCATTMASTKGRASP